MTKVSGAKSSYYKLERGIDLGLGKAFPKGTHLKQEVKTLSEKIEEKERLLGRAFTQGFHPRIGFLVAADSFSIIEQRELRSLYRVDFTDQEFFCEGNFFSALRESIKEQFNSSIVTYGFSKSLSPGLLTLRILRECGQESIFFNRDLSYITGASATLPFVKLFNLFSAHNIIARFRYDLEAFEIIPESFPDVLENLNRIPEWTETYRATQGWNFGEIEVRYLLGLIYGDVLDFLVTLPGTDLGNELCEEIMLM